MRLPQRLHRWHQLSHYYFNRWQYEGFKWMERMWYGQKDSNKAVCIPFMITMETRQQLSKAGFPNSMITELKPATAQTLVREKVTYSEYLKNRECKKIEADAN
uniref:Uncharacterized protein AlNc14C131G6968 n=1 Tax=Albugo laibachii Nc14 TaxID=890382 RepID=F0WKB5_9STRA|nr:conserved hypothetical protein [Albugo laibachii Nc14]CCA21856.1 conserved hypothetical protein [Albugo laibachii Nc14]|eukprot:CCA21856.1 conserved hypothetical protein [Albugo laibachii Nc14]